MRTFPQRGSKRFLHPALLGAALALLPTVAPASDGSGMCGQVRDAQGESLAAAHIEVSGPGGTMTARTDAHGEYCVDVPPGTWRVRASAAGYREEVFDDVEVHEGTQSTVNPTLDYGF